MLWGGLMAVWGGLTAVWGGLVEVGGGLGCFNGPSLTTINIFTTGTNELKRVTIHPSKSNVVLLKNHKSVTKKNVKVELNGNNISLSENTTHLGLLRAEVNENIDDRLRLARRTLYSLIIVAELRL